MSQNQIGSILLFILAIPLGIYAVYSWKLTKERYGIIDKLLKDIGTCLIDEVVIRHEKLSDTSEGVLDMITKRLEENGEVTLKSGEKIEER